MNSDPYDSAAWKTFGMLDSDESALFDEAMRHDPLLRAAYHEMNRLGAAVAASAAAPIPVRAGQLERLLIRAGLLAPAKRSPLWFGISGWAAAAILTLALIMNRSGGGGRGTSAKAAPDAAARPPQVPANLSAPAATTPQDQQQTAAAAAPTTSTDASSPAAVDGKAVAKVETKRLVQEIEVLRENLQQFEERDRLLFDALPGRALPLIMTMLPPGQDPEESLALSSADAGSPLTAMLGDALAAITRNSVLDAEATEMGDAAAVAAAPGNQEVTAPLNDGLPAAIPIYDAARDSGTLVVRNLPTAEQGQAYHLWVTTTAGERPVYVGSLPESSATGSDSFDFSLGSSMVLPSGFVLTKDPVGTPAIPSDKNTILLGPPPPQP